MITSISYTIKTNRGKSFNWIFTLIHNKDDYGNGNYVVITCDEELKAYVDVRYQRFFNLETFAETYIKGWYGDNLLYMKKDDFDKSPF